MKRDMSLIRLLMLNHEGETDVTEALSGYTEKQQVYHTAQLIESGLLKGQVSEDESCESICATVIGPILGRA